jgi:phage terminase small subunit
MVSMALTAKQQRFVAEYAVDLNATQAAIRAGYSPHTAKQQGSRLLTDVDVAAALVNIQQQAVAKVAELVEERVIDTAWVLARSVEIVERCMQAVPVRDREGNETGEWEFDASGANKALDRIAKHTGGFTEKHEGEPDKHLHVHVMGQLSVDDLRRLASGDAQS